MHLTRTVPALPVRDSREAAAFYRDRLGFTVGHEAEGFAGLARDDAEVHLWQADQEDWRNRSTLAQEPVRSGAESFIAGTASCRIEVDEVDALWQEMHAAGVLHHTDPGAAQDTDWGTREFAVTDLDNNLVVFFRRRSPSPAGTAPPAPAPDSPAPAEADLQHLHRCVELATEALEAGDEPFGSVLVGADGTVLAEDHNRVATGDRTRHPEIELARWAAAHLSPEERAAATVFTSGEHCPMCSAAHGWVGLGRIVYASSSEQLGSWLAELGVPAPPVRSLPIGEVVPGLVVEGPFPELAEEVHDLHRRLHGR